MDKDKPLLKHMSELLTQNGGKKDDFSILAVPELMDSHQMAIHIHNEILKILDII